MLQTKRTLDSINDDVEPSDEIVSIIAITCHGKIFCKKDTSPDMFNVPLKVRKATVASEGYTTCYVSAEIDQIIQKIIENKSNLLSSREDISQHAISRINSYLGDIHTNYVNEKYIHDYIKHTNSHHSHDFQQNYIKNNHLGFNIFELNSGDLMYNKLYSRKNSEKNGLDMAIPIIEHPHFFINSVTDDYTDLMTLIGHPYGKNNTIIHTKMILDYFKSIGTTKLIIFDLSCSTIHGENDESRQCSMAKISQRRLPFGGKKKKRKNHTYKKRSHTKKRKCKRIKN